MYDNGLHALILSYPENAEWKKLAREQHHIPAIKALRISQGHNFGLKEAKDCVEWYVDNLIGGNQTYDANLDMNVGIVHTNIIHLDESANRGLQVELTPTGYTIRYIETICSNVSEANLWQAIANAAIAKAKQS